MRLDVRCRQHDADKGRFFGWWSVALVFCVFLSSGCATLTIPAFDPSGNRIFASQPTQLTLPQLHGPTGTSIVPNASFPEPPNPPACLQGPPPPTQTISSPTPRNNDDRGRCGQMLLTPTRIVAPVGGEVVLLAGVCGEDGYLVSGEPIEWMLSPDSVGEIIEVGDDMKGKRKSFFASKSMKPAVEKLDVDFARGRTSAEAGRITRGSMRESDDLIVKKGQTWVSLTSPTEGMSRVTVLAPDSDVWDRRRQTATIYWIDASWQFPGPQSLRVGEPATLVTQVKKSEGYAPATNWIVKYRLLTEGFGQFLTNNPNALGGTDVRVDQDGKAFAQLVNPTGKPGTAVVGIEVARPADPDAKMPELPLAKGQTMITWSAPVLNLKVNGNDTSSVNQPVDYTVTLANAGDMAAENVKLVMDLKNPALQAAFLRETPTARANLGATWDIGTIPARHVFEAVIQITPTAEAAFTIDFVASATGQQNQLASMPLLAVRPQLGLRFTPAQGSEQVEVNQPVVFDIVATNSGKQTIDNLTLLIDSDPGLQHENGSNRVQLPIRYLSAGQSQRVGVRYIARKPGQLSAKMVAQINGVSVGEPTSAFVRVIEPVLRQPAMKVQLVPQSGNTSLAPGAVTGVNAVVQNRGQTLLTNIQVVVEYESSLELTSVSAGGDNRPMNRMVAWPVAQLEPGKQIAFDMAFRSIAPSPQPAIRLSARSGEGITDQNTLTFNIAGNDAGTDRPVLPFANPDNNVLPSTGSRPPSNPWSLVVQPIDQSVTVGGTSRFAITFQNNLQQADQNVALSIAIPQGVRVQTVVANDGTPIGYEFSADGSSIQLKPIAALRVGETASMILELRHEVPGAFPIGVTIRSAAQPQPVTEQARVSVRPNL